MYILYVRLNWKCRVNKLQLYQFHINTKDLGFILKWLNLNSIMYALLIAHSFQVTMNGINLPAKCIDLYSAAFDEKYGSQLSLLQQLKSDFTNEELQP